MTVWRVKQERKAGGESQWWASADRALSQHLLLTVKFGNKPLDAFAWRAMCLLDLLQAADALCLVLVPEQGGVQRSR